MEWDVLVVGAGPAGSAFASRYAPRRGNDAVLLLDRGPDHTAYPQTTRVDTIVEAQTSRHLMREAWSAPQPGLGGRRVLVKAGAVAGGSQPFNGGTFLAGRPEDYAAWPSGWRWEDVGPAIGGLLDDLPLSEPPPDELSDAWIAAAAEAGHRIVDDVHRSGRAGVGRPLVSFDAAGARITAWSRLLPAARERCPRLEVRTGAEVARIVFDGRRAAGVVLADGEAIDLAPGGTLVLAAGAVETPRLLMRSGVGPADELDRAGVPRVAVADGVGRNLSDRFGVPIVTASWRRSPPTALPKTNLIASSRAGGDPDLLFYLQSLNGPARGLMTTAYFEPVSLLRAVQRVVGVVAAPLRPLVLAHLVLGLPTVRPSARGRVTLDAVDPGLRDPRGLDALIAAVRLFREILATPTAKAWGMRELATRGLETDEQLRAFVAANAFSVWHSCGTCRMAERAEDGPVDPELRLRGVDGVRVIDASVLPTGPACGPTPAILAVARIAADRLASGATSAG